MSRHRVGEKRSMKPMTKALFAATCAMASMAGLSAEAMAQISGDTVKIGVLNDQSGLYADFGGRGPGVAAQRGGGGFRGRAVGGGARRGGGGGFRAGGCWESRSRSCRLTIRTSLTSAPTSRGNGSTW